MQKKVLLSILVTICLGMSGFALSSCEKTEGNEGHVHTESVVISKDATCTETGSKHIECTVCGEVLQTEEIPALGHDYVDGVCTRCGEADPDYKVAVQTWDVSEKGDRAVMAYLYEADATGYYTLSIKGTGAMKNWSSYSTVPWYSSYSSKITGATIGSGVTSIGECAFWGCSSLTSVSFGENSQLTSIGLYAFYYCSSLTSIVIPSSVTSIGNYAFYKCSSLTSVSFGENSQLTSIGYEAFEDCDSLTSIVIPSSVTSIGDWAFYGCSSLTSIEIPSSVTSIGWYAFWGCDSLTIYCEAESQPVGWDSSWNESNRPVVWGYKKTN